MSITIDKPVWEVRIECDGRRVVAGLSFECDQTQTVRQETREACNDVLLRTGWALHKGKTLCPDCARELKEKLKSDEPGGEKGGPA